MTVENKDDDVLWEAEGMVHRIALTEAGTNGSAILQISRIRGAGYESATLLPVERYELAKALYPEAFEGHPEPLKQEYGVLDRNGRTVKEHAYLTERLADLIYVEPDETLVVRKVTPWVKTEQKE